LELITTKPMSFYNPMSFYANYKNNTSKVKRKVYKYNIIVVLLYYLIQLF